MKKYSTLALFGLLCTFAFPQNNPSLSILSQTDILVGTNQGLFKVSNISAAPLWTESGIKKIVPSRPSAADLNGQLQQETAVPSPSADLWYFLTDKGIYSSPDLISFIPCNEGLPFNVIKKYDGKSKSFVREVQELKDLEMHQDNPAVLVTATKDAVYLSINGGKNWKSLGLSAKTSGVKAVAVASMPAGAAGAVQLTVFASHPIYGLSYCLIDKNGNRQGKWTDINTGFELMETSSYADEIADITAVIRGGAAEIYLSQSFRPRIYRLDWNTKQAILLWKGKEPACTIDSLAYTSTDDSLLYITPSGFAVFSLAAAGAADTQQQVLSTAATEHSPNEADFWQRQIQRAPGIPAAAWIPSYYSGGRGNLAFNELWLLTPGAVTSPYASLTDNKQGLYLPIGKVLTDSALNSYISVMEQNNLNTAIIDMKDDYGYLRYDAKDPLVTRKGAISKYGITLDSFVSKMKEKNIYLVARIVVFKDKALSKYGGGKYAVWDKTLSVPWVGTRGMVSEEMTFYDENWVDPYSEEVWEYNIAVARELIARGFDEIQFDYIRFPTDGLNINNAVYRYQEQGMDKESALMSFLSYARENITAPIGIDIYGANGWYRTGSRTGQDIELLAKYVDVICPMFYPSHFEQGFLAQEPAEERPYRIYYYGSYRSTVIARNQVLIRPWTQAFYLNVSYDRTYYNKEYVSKQIFGIRDSIDNGFMYWNNSGRYTDIRPAPAADTPYTGKSPEAAPEFRHPVL